jgi:hypothetical protein
MATSMETQTQDTHPQDPIDRFALRLEEMRRDSEARGLARLVQNLILDFFLAMMKLLAGLAEQRRNGTLPAVPEPAVAAEGPARAWPADLRPRESGWAESRDLYDPWGDSPARGQAERPEAIEPTEALHVGAPGEISPNEPPRVEQPVGLPLPRAARVRSAKDRCEPVQARSQHVDRDWWPVSCGRGLLWTADAGFPKAFSQKWFERPRGSCVFIVTI